MMRLARVVFLTFFVALGCRAQSYRSFTDSQGRTIKARIVSYDATKGRINIERQEDEQCFWVSPDSFSAENRRYITEWITANQILSEDNLEITLKKKKLATVKVNMDENCSPRETEGQKGETICYQVTLRNRSDKPIENIRMEYRFYVMEDHVDENKEEIIRELYTENEIVEIIGPGKAHSFNTIDETIVNHYKRAKPADAGPTTYEYDCIKTSEEVLLGFWLRIYGPKVDGEPCIRDVCDPEDFREKRTWSGLARPK